MINHEYPLQSWTQAYTDGSAREALTMEGAYIKCPNGETETLAIPVRKQYSNFKAEVKAIKLLQTI